MKFLYRQPEGGNIFSDFGIEKCCLKHITAADSSSKRRHHHTFFELHFILEGCQIYEIDEQNYEIKKGHFLLISPLCKHKVSGAYTDILKLSLNFSTRDSITISAAEPFIFDKTPPAVASCIDKILAEKKPSVLSARLTENAVFEIAAYILRLLGIEEAIVKKAPPSENICLSLAKQYIKDNAEYSPSVSEVAAFCHLSAKHLTRLFAKDGMTPASYIRRQRLNHAENLLVNSSLSLWEISRKLNFSSEYYFNTFFRKHYGMSPGEYRKANK